jgi:hypothetical protein
MATISVLIVVYYNMIVGWVLLYLWEMLSGGMNAFRWNSCENEWNTAGMFWWCLISVICFLVCLPSRPNNQTCQIILGENEQINASIITKSAIYYNGICRWTENTTQPTEEFYKYDDF